jgi:Putative adhesin
MLTLPVDPAHPSRGWALATAVIGTLIIAAPACAGPRVAAAGVGDDDVQGRFEKTLNVSSPADVNVSTGSGSIDVKPGSDGSIHVVGTIHVGNRWMRRNDSDAMARVHEIEQNPPIEQDGNRVRIGETHDDRRYENISISYTVTVPRGTSLVSSSGSGSQEIGALAGPVRASTGSGSLHIGATGGMVHAGTGSGSITVDGAKDRVEASTGSGSISLHQIAGSAKASSGSGTIELEQTAKGNVDLNTASGQIRVRGANGALTAGTASGSITITGGKPDANWSLSSSSGTISLDLPSGFGFTLDARTTSGSLDIDHPVTISSIHGRNREVHGAVNGGGPTVSVETTSGSIHIGAR